MTYKTEEERRAAIKESRRRYHKKTYKPVKIDKRKIKDKNPYTKEKILFHAAKYRAAKRGLDFTIELEDIIIPPTCPVLGIPIRLDCPKTDPSSPSLDRKDTTKGYTKENIQVISWRANKLKSDALIWEVECLLDYMKT